MLKSSKHPDKTLLEIRQENMQKWTEEDFRFYEELFEDLHEIKKPSSSSKTPKEDDNAEEAYREFKLFMNQISSKKA